MTENPSGKVQPVLAEYISRTAAPDLNQSIQVVVGATAGPSAIGEVTRQVRELGGEPVREREAALECRIPIGRVTELAKSSTVSYVRLARIHSIS